MQDNNRSVIFMWDCVLFVMLLLARNKSYADPDKYINGQFDRYDWERGQMNSKET